MGELLSRVDDTTRQTIGAAAYVVVALAVLVPVIWAVTLREGKGGRIRLAGITVAAFLLAGVAGFLAGTGINRVSGAYFCHDLTLAMATFGPVFVLPLVERPLRLRRWGLVVLLSVVTAEILAIPFFLYA